MEAIFHEKQEGSLCAQHCLNGLLQGRLFTAVDLAEIAQNLDERERQTMLEGGVNTNEYQQFLQQPSTNYDDSGYFSIQVLQEALRVWNLELIPYTSSNSIAQDARQDPTTQKAYICNFRQHWFSIRKLGNQWFNLNSLLTGPELISNTYLALFLTQLQQEGYSLFVVVGDLAESEADQLLCLMPAVQPIKPSLINQSGQHVDESHFFGNDDQLQKALRESQTLSEREDAALQRALRDSMSGNCVDEPAPTSSCSSSPNQTPSAEELRAKRLAYLQGEGNANMQSPNTASSPVDKPNDPEGNTEDTELQAALQMSMQQP